MSENITPALSAEQWHDVLSGFRLSSYLIDSRALDVADVEDDTDKVVAVAMANHALPDDSPYKITRADVALLAEAVAKSDEHYDELSTIVAKLAALLPPLADDGDTP